MKEIEKFKQTASPQQNYSFLLLNIVMKSSINSTCCNPVPVASLVRKLVLFSQHTSSYRCQSFQYSLCLLSFGTFYAAQSCSKLVYGFQPQWHNGICLLAYQMIFEYSIDLLLQYGREGKFCFALTMFCYVFQYRYQMPKATSACHKPPIDLH